MNEIAVIVEATLIRGRLLVTFADGKIAFLEPDVLYGLAIRSESFRMPPQEPELV